MSGATNIILFGGARRVRVLCTQPLAASAFTSIGYYAIGELDGIGAIPGVNAVFAVANTPNAFELAANVDLVAGGLYSVTVTALPFADASTFTGTIEARVPSQANTPNPQGEPSTGDFDLYFYGRDVLLGDNGDFALSATGDLATTSGTTNWQAALLRRAMSAGIPWDGSYGAKPNNYVNAPPQYQLPLSARLVQQARADDRTLSAQCQLVPNPGGAAGRFGFQLTAQGRDGLSPISLTIPTPAGTG